MKTIISGKTKNEVIDRFKSHMKETGLGIVDNSLPPCALRFKRNETVDGNPSAAIKMCFPYRTSGVRKMRGRNGFGTYGD